MCQRDCPADFLRHTEIRLSAECMFALSSAIKPGEVSCQIPIAIETRVRRHGN